MDVLPLGLTGDGALRAAVAADREVTRLEGVRLTHLAEYLGEVAAEWQPPGWQGPGAEQPIRLGGAGTPEIPEFAVCEVAAALGLSQPAATGLCADVLDLTYRLRGIATSVRAGVLSFARARVIARRTRDLTPEQAEVVEARLSRPRDTARGPEPMAALVPMSRLRTVIDQAVIAVRGPETEEEAEARVAESLYVEMVHEAGSATDLAARLATADAARLDRRLDEVSGWLTELGDARPKKVLRAVALGLLADPALLAALQDLTTRGAAPAEIPGSPTAAGMAGLPSGLLDKLGKLASTVLYVHLDRGTGTWCEENAGVLTKEEAQRIVGHSDVTIRPVLDLAEELTYTGYVAPARLKEQLALQNSGYCTFPSCHRRARTSDVDHQTPAASDGATRSGNTHRLCRKHHRAKDKGGWRVVEPVPGVWVWASPAGAVYLVGNAVTTPLNGIFTHIPPGERAAPVSASDPRTLDTPPDGRSWKPAWDPWNDWDPLTQSEHEHTYGFINSG